MELYIAIRGPKRGKIFDMTEPGMLEEVYTRIEHGREVPVGYTGLIVPYGAMEDQVIKFRRQFAHPPEKLLREYSNK